MLARPGFWVPFFIAALVHALPVAAGGQLGAGTSLMVVSWTDSGSGQGMLRAFATSPPFGDASPTVSIGRDSTIRYALGRVYAVSPTDDTITVIDPNDGWSVEKTYALAKGSEPKDIAVTGPRTAYVTRGGSASLLRLDLVTGATQDVADLGPFADSDGNPDMAMMILHEGRLFVQIRRLDFLKFQFLLPAMLVVVDAKTGNLIDVDPIEPGVQAIELQGTPPKGKMQVISSQRLLYVSATGDFFDEGGIETIDLDTLQSAGFVIEEADGKIGAELGPFRMIQPDRGYLAFSTDLALSSHLFGFSVPGGVDPGPELLVSVNYLAPVFMHDPHADTLFVPQAGSSPDGVQVFQASTGTKLTANEIPTGDAPDDLQLVYFGCGAGDVNGDGKANGLDIQAFVDCAVQAANCPCADLDGSGSLDNTDAQLLVAALTES